MVKHVIQSGHFLGYTIAVDTPGPHPYTGVHPASSSVDTSCHRGACGWQRRGRVEVSCTAAVRKR
jgi:hypothetical protein